MWYLYDLYDVYCLKLFKYYYCRSYFLHLTTAVNKSRRNFVNYLFSDDVLSKMVLKWRWVSVFARMEWTKMRNIYGSAQLRFRDTLRGIRSSMEACFPIFMPVWHSSVFSNRWTIFIRSGSRMPFPDHNLCFVRYSNKHS